MFKHRTYELNQQVVHNEPVNIETTNMLLEGVEVIFFRYDAELDATGELFIDDCEIGVTFAEGGDMFIRSTDDTILEAFGFNYEEARDNANTYLLEA